MTRTVLSISIRAPGFGPRSAFAVLLAVALIPGTGCRQVGSGLVVPAAAPSAPSLGLGVPHQDIPQQAGYRGSLRSVAFNGASSVALPTTDQLAAAYRRAYDAEARHDAWCVDGYYRAASASWGFLEYALAQRFEAPRYSDAWRVYHDSLARLVVAAQQHGRRGPAGSLLVESPAGPGRIEVRYFGFPWQPRPTHQLIPASGANELRLARSYRRDGLGVTLVALRRSEPDEPFLAQNVSFATTAILRVPPEPAAASSHQLDNAPPIVGVLELHDALRVDSVNVGGRQLPLARDISAPLSLLASVTDTERTTRFFLPDSGHRGKGLRMLEPFQPGKIPLVFVHGLLSDGLTWVNMANDLRAIHGVADYYQIWAFDYATGEPFMRSAETLREQCQQARSYFDPSGRDPAMSRMVLVGHSMGGLVAKLQVTSSGTTLWDRVANRPLEALRASERDIDQLRRLFFFEPQPFITRVVFIGTPHQGSPWATRLSGRILASRVRPDEAQVAFHDRLIRNNPDTFSAEVERRIPTSIDLLEPDSALLNGISRLAISPHVQLHTVAGTGRRMVGSGPADGIVPVSSTHHPGAASQRLVDAVHTRLHEHPDTVAELLRILVLHLSE